MAKMYKHVFFRNKIVDASEANLSIASSAVLYGLSVYTVFPVSLDKKGVKFAFRLPEHFERLINSAKIIGIDTFEPEWTYAKFKKAVQELVDANIITKKLQKIHHDIRHGSHDSANKWLTIL